uniref:Uncharacterized protein n=1 Tax=Amphimedon queenslandica TaxID=400682 RepID=A0A1X7UTE1_AMPQE
MEFHPHLLWRSNNNNNKQQTSKQTRGGGDSNTGQILLSEYFLLKLLASLDEQLGRTKWVVPVRANDEMETLIKASNKLAKESNG